MDTSKTMYRISKNLYDTKIEEIEVLSETPKTVMLRGYRDDKQYREYKDTVYTSIHETWEQARDVMLGIARRKVESAKTRLKACEDDMRKVEAMKCQK